MPPRRELIHRYTRRKKGHDYYSPCRYHLILRKAPSCPFYGHVSGDVSVGPYGEGAPYIAYNKLGKILSGKAFTLDKIFKALKMYCYKVMPDHIHMFLYVREKTDMHLGDYVGRYKHLVAEEYSRFCGKEIHETDIFEENYTDKIVYAGRDFNPIFRYIDLNPYRLAVRFDQKYFFERKGVFEFDGEQYEGYGNHFLLENPFKMAVHVAHDASEAQFEEQREKWLEHVAEGGVLVSPFISQREKRIRKEAAEMGGKIIQIKNEAFTEKYHPGETDFNLCIKGQLLQIAPKHTLGPVVKPVCRIMNGLSRMIAEGEF